ncbi:MAG: diaminopimelate epimerase [Rubrivivax sp.]|jgi:diaminopimelate epimerase|nr:diaminopimelate epimerase [Betaproteobacteria bacterium]MBP6320236.1 diaminopimelate epimerase [Rubrivivax sp.]MBK7460305.1 diaminopimelate epimerase [Betaproteobacteria bacterium]MBK7516229.1 diaminopimelate epimerase [Betaproteobacteria bacterium]MBK8107926.1 diaminopimelate epimerase [Betaproteobacteria bacterium]
MRLKFTKMQGAGNDFVVLDALRSPLELTPALARRLADRRFGIGADQILLVEPSRTPGIDFRYRIYNSSGEEVEHCGNGARCFVRYLHEHGLSDKTTVTVETVNNVLELRLGADGRVTVDMNRPVFEHARIPFDATGLVPRRESGFELWPLADAGAGVEVAVLSMGNPHAVMRVADVDTAPVALLGPRIETHARFPRHVNAGFMQVLEPDAVRLRVHERGAGETLACGTGACAAVVAGIRLGWLARRVTVQARGGELLVEWPRDDASVLMTGPAETVFEGEIQL